MNQDIIPINPRRGSLRPPARPVAYNERPVAPRLPNKGPVSMDGMKSPATAHKSLLNLNGSGFGVKSAQPAQSAQQSANGMRGVVLSPITTSAADSAAAKNSGASQPVPATPVPLAPSTTTAPAPVKPLINDVAVVPKKPVVVPSRPLDINEIENLPVGLPEVKPTPVQKDSIAEALAKEIAEPAESVKRSKFGKSKKAEKAKKSGKKREATQASLAETPKDGGKAKKKFDFKKHGFIGFAIIILLITAYISVDTWFTNKEAQAIVTGTTGQSSTGAHTKEAEGKDETPVDANALSNYTVAAEYPRALYVNKINVAARILPMSVNSDNSVQAPLNIYDAGWYTGSVKPGEIGAAFIDGHASGATRQGLFGNLDRLVMGDTVEVEKGDGTKLTYKVVHTETVPLEGLDMKKVLLPHGNVLKALNIMTCTGNWLEDKQTFDQRVVVYTELVE